ncbi:hypothetical protein, partial [Roseisalinus antarcticus]|uniref:hypothetical protein n=1 Tax=Roseisalinus antarcticus TaxID=254357 RepID=UPI001F31463F
QTAEFSWFEAGHGGSPGTSEASAYLTDTSEQSTNQHALLTPPTIECFERYRQTWDGSVWAYSVEKLCHAKSSPEIWNIVVVTGQLANLVSGRTRSRENILLVRLAGRRK